MAITRRLLAQDSEEDNQWLKVDHSSRFIVNDSDSWQFIFNVNSDLSSSIQVLKLSAQLDTNTLDKIRVAGYLYNAKNGSVDTAASMDFRIYRVADITSPKWDDILITTLSGDSQPNNYFFKDIDIVSLIGANLDGETSIMIEGTAVRSGVTYRDRIYVNHLGVYDSVIRLRQDVEWLDISKLDE